MSRLYYYNYDYYHGTTTTTTTTAITTTTSTISTHPFSNALVLRQSHNSPNGSLQDLLCPGCITTTTMTTTTVPRQQQLLLLLLLLLVLTLSPMRWSLDSCTMALMSSSVRLLCPGCTTTTTTTMTTTMVPLQQQLLLLVLVLLVLTLSPMRWSLDSCTIALMSSSVRLAVSRLYYYYYNDDYYHGTTTTTTTTTTTSTDPFSNALVLRQLYNGSDVVVCKACRG